MSKTSSALNGIEYCCICRRSYPLGATHSCYALGSSGQTEPGLKTEPPEIELRIRKETMEAIDELVIEIFKESSSKRMQDLSEFIQDRLYLLWGK